MSMSPDERVKQIIEQSLTQFDDRFDDRVALNLMKKAMAEAITNALVRENLIDFEFWRPEAEDEPTGPVEDTTWVGDLGDLGVIDDGDYDTTWQMYTKAAGLIVQEVVDATPVKVVLTNAEKEAWVEAMQESVVELGKRRGIDTREVYDTEPRCQLADHLDAEVNKIITGVTEPTGYIKPVHPPQAENQRPTS